MKRHNDIPTAHNIPPKIARHEPIPNIIDPTENEQFLQDIQQQELTDMFSSQFGHGLTQFLPPTGPVCEVCGKVFAALKNLKQHQRTIHEKTTPSFSCTECDYTTPRKSNFNRHMKRHNDIPTAHNIPPKIARHEPIPNIIDPTENEQFLQDIQQQELTDMFSSQFGHGLTQFLPPTGPVCEVCGKVFAALKNLKQHQRTIHEKTTPSFSCTECDYTTPRKSNFNRHMKRHNDIPTAHNIPPKIARHEPFQTSSIPPKMNNFYKISSNRNSLICSVANLAMD